MELFVQSLVSGLLLGGLYAAVGVGLSLVFGIMGLTNIAHGCLMILSSFFIMVFARHMSGSVVAAFILTVLVMCVIGALLQGVLINRVLAKGPEPALLVTFGVAIVIWNVLQLIFGADFKSIPSPMASVNAVNTRWVVISGEYLFNFAVSAALILVLHLVIQKTLFGRAIRAAASNVVAAELMGINTGRTYIYIMCLALATGSVGGLLVGQTFGFYSYSGMSYLIIAFGVVVIGGMGSIIGTLLGGVILGVAQLLGAYFFGSGVQILVGYLTLLTLLTLRPRGLLGNMTRE
ncbi:MAG: branched-chain amino acid ABC transporter permease [Clostridiales Family XIII bacterium]|jgi:branched-chain amino acid transport system permease protein|nr:branched-chain amino acid ABC transporter permease [Clostridiales Family XIII bacterium]